MGTGVIALGGGRFLICSFRVVIVPLNVVLLFGLWLLPRWAFIYCFVGLVGFDGVILRSFFFAVLVFVWT